MSAEMIVRNCSPTLAGMKAGSIFTCAFADRTAMCRSIRAWNRVLGKKGLRVLSLRYRDGRALIYIYRVSRLGRDLCQKDVLDMLREIGYDCATPERCIVQLIRRLDQCKDFPHEIGLFLGYPAEDVRGFIQNSAAGCKLVGYWKVYGDVDAAERTFARYRKCTSAYMRELAKGTNIERLVIAG